MRRFGRTATRTEFDYLADLENAALTTRQFARLDREGTMRRLYRSIMGAALLANLTFGCGSTSDTQPGLVMRFIQFSGVGIEQQDAVNANNADVDITPSCCSADFLFTEVTFESFTQTIVNAVFVNEEKSDILLTSYRIHFDDPSFGIGDATYNISANLRGKRCSNDEFRSCATEADCQIPGSMTTDITCDAQETIVGGILLFDFVTKAQLRSESNRKNLGLATSVSISFFGADPNRTFRADTSYVVTFDAFCNCPDGTFCIPGGILQGCDS